MTRPRADIHKCLSCGNDYLEGYPHRHATEPRSGYDPMPPKPTSRQELVWVIAREYGAEKPPRIHARQVPSRAEPIAVSQYSAEAAGFVVTDEEIAVLDTGELGAPPWSSPFHRYVGGIHLWDGEMIVDERDLEPSPWTRNLEGVRRWCAGKHRTWYEHQSKPLCWLLIRLVICGGYSVGRAAIEEQVPIDTADVLLFGHRDRQCDHVGHCPDGAFDKWWAWTSNDVNGLRSVRMKPKAA
jgi:hypothetical protein